MNMSKKSIGRHTGTGAGKQKMVSWSYQLVGKRVCKSMFLRTLGYTSDKVLTVTRMNDTIEDGRGKGIIPSNKISEDEIRRIKYHIGVVYEPNVSHYRREHAPKHRYLDSCLTINGMHKRYKEDFGGHPISYYFFRKIISDMNISFTKLGHEQCEGCLTHEEHKCAPPNVECPKEVCKDCCAYEEHVKNAALARSKYKDDAAQAVIHPSKTTYLSCDLQKVKMLPEIPGVKTAVFTQRIAAYNETFSPLGKGTGLKSVAVIWHQGLMGRNDEDVTSAFIKILNQAELQKRPEVVLWLDNCSAQN